MAATARHRPLIVPAALGGLGLAALVALILLFAVVAGQQPCATGTAATGGAPSAAGRKAIPARLMPIYLRAQAQYGVPWNLLAAINYIETDFGHNTSTSSAGALGWMQFEPSTWATYGVDGNRDGRKDPYDPADAIPAAARYLKASGAPDHIRRAVFAYNHATWYVDQVLAEAKALTQGATLTADTAASAGETGCAAAATGPANLDQAVTVTGPRRYATLPAWAMAAGRTPEQVDARILPDALWLLRTYNLRVTAAREAGHHTHGDGTALDLVPATSTDQQAWDTTARRLAHDVGWTEGCAAVGVAPVCPLKPWVRFVGYNGYPGHGDPAHAGRNAHLHLSWYASHYGAPVLVPPNAWVRVFPASASSPQQGGSTILDGNRPSLLLLGDSLAVGTAPYLPAALTGWQIRVDGRIGRPLAEGMRQLAALHATPTVLAVSLFTNDDPRHLAQLRAAVRTSLRNQRCVVWATISRPPVAGVSYTAANQTLRQLPNAYLGRLYVVDWAHAVHRHPNWLATDRVHATPSGWIARARLYANAAERCAP